MAGYSVVSLGDMVSEYGEDKVKLVLSTFSCPQNADVEMFIKSKAMEFEKQALSKTHLVYASYKNAQVWVGYYTLANKSISIKGSILNSRWRSRLKRFANSNTDTTAYILAIPLIAQLGKNFANGNNKLITGAELLDLACETVKAAQSLLGGRFVYLECEEKPRLLDFYKDNGFYVFDKRLLDKDERSWQDGYYLAQLLKYLR